MICQSGLGSVRIKQRKPLSSQPITYTIERLDEDLMEEHQVVSGLHKARRVLLKLEDNK